MIMQHAYSPATEATKRGIVEIEDQHRSSLYVLLSSLLSGPPTTDLLSKVNTLSGGENKIGEAVKTLNTLSKKLGIKTIEREYNNLFIGVGRGELLPYASFYMTGFLNEKPLANLRDDMNKIGISRSPSTSDPEDHIASLCEMMSGIITNQFYTTLSLRQQSDFFATHLGPWAKHFFDDLIAAEYSVFYAPVGALGKAFIGIETEAFKF